MRFHHVLALTASVGVASAKKCKPRTTTALSSAASSLESSSTLESTIASESTAVSVSISVSETATSETATATGGAGEETSTTATEEATSTDSSTESETASETASTETAATTETATSETATSEAATSEAATSETASETATTSETTTSSEPTPTVPAEPREICQVKGTSNAAAFRTSTKITDTSFTACRALCLAEESCKGFSIEIKTGGACSLYDSALYLDFLETENGSTFFFDSDCPAPVVEGPKIVLAAPSAPSTPIESVPKGPGPVATFPAYTPPSIVSSDSPPYTPTGPQPTPANDWDFVQTYTYTQYDLPTMVDAGRPPVTTGIELEMPSAAPCLMEAGSDSPFTLLNEDFIPMVTRTGSVGPLLQPTEAPAPDDPILNPLTYKVPSFYLNPVAGESDVYDMVYVNTGEYVAMTTDGQVVLVGASTGTSFSGEHVTGIFTLDCRGTISIVQGGNKYTWSTEGESCSIKPADTPKNNMKALPVSLPKIEVQNEKRTAELIEVLKRRGATKKSRDLSSDFHEPQCPNTPPGLVMKTKSDYNLGEGNFCEDLSEWWGLSPFDFDTACEIQSLCFDQCENFSFAGCVGIFSYAMYLTCADNFKDWWDVIKAGACAAQATVFVGLVSSDTGHRLYNKAQSAMCRCFCSDPPDTCVYLDKDGNLSDKFYCANLHGSDMLNCGSCGGQCGANSACKKGACGCPGDQCGTTCLDLRNNPNHCGSCDTKCDSKYCIGGACYTPKPGECTPDQAVTNNWFADWQYGFTNWTMGAFPGTTLGTDVTFGASSYTWKAGEPAVRAISVKMDNLPQTGHHAMLTQKRVKICPGFNYELKFNMGYVNSVNNNNVVSNADCQVRWLTGVPSAPAATDGFRASPWYNIGASYPTYQTFGPWPMGAFAEGQAGVTKERMNLYIDLTAVIQCTTPVGGFGKFIITAIEVNPTTPATKRSEMIGEVEELEELEKRDAKGSAEMAKQLRPITNVVGEDSALVVRSVRGRF